MPYARTAGLLAGLVAATALAVPASADYGSAKAEYVVPTRHGHIFLAVSHPTLDGKVVRSGSVLTYSPYYGTLSGRLGDASTWNREGLTRIAADVVGTGNSGGCYDYGGKRERETGYDVVEWVARQPWSNGRVGMIGGSYDGSTAIATASLRPPHLTTIVPEAAISRWYDYAYSGGMRYTVNNERMSHQDPGLVIDEQGFDTPLAFDFGISTVPPTDPANPHYQERVVSRMQPCEEVEHIRNGYSVNPDYDAFWVDRDYVRNASQVTIPVLVALNWGDWNVKQETGVRYWEALTHSRFRRLAVGTRWEGHGTPGGDSGYKELRVEWMRHFLSGARNAVPRTPPVISQTSDSKGAGPFITGPVPRTTPLRLFAQEKTVNGYGRALLPSKPGEPGAGVTYVPTGSGTESGALASARTGTGAAWFESPVLKQDVRIFGSPTAQVWSTVQRTWVTYAVSVVDIDPAFYTAAADQRQASETDALLGVTRGWLDSRYRNTLTKRQPWKPGLNGATVVAKPQDYVFRKGHAIGLLVMGEQTEWVVPKAYDDPAGGAGPTVVVDTSGRTVLTLPVVGRVDPFRVF